MSLDKAIAAGKEHRAPYHSATTKAFCRSCRNHGSCPHCRDNRQYQRRKHVERTQDAMDTDQSVE